MFRFTFRLLGPGCGGDPYNEHIASSERRRNCSKSSSYPQAVTLNAVCGFLRSSRAVITWGERPLFALWTKTQVSKWSFQCRRAPVKPSRIFAVVCETLNSLGA